MFRFALAYILVLLWFGTVFAQNLSSLSTQQLQLFNLLNEERAKAGVPKFEWDDHLSKSASAHARLMAEKKELSHNFPGEPKLGERVGGTGLRLNSAAESVASGPTPEEIHRALMNSPPDRAKILDPTFNAVGIGVELRDGDWYVAENFAHTLPPYTEDDFRSELVAEFHKTRQAGGAARIDAESDSHLHDVACSQNPDPHAIIQTLPGATDVVIFTSSIPEKLPSEMTRAASDQGLKKMSIGVCFRPGSTHGYGNFLVVVALYPK